MKILSLPIRLIKHYYRYGNGADWRHELFKGCLAIVVGFDISYLLWAPGVQTIRRPFDYRCIVWTPQAYGRQDMSNFFKILIIVKKNLTCRLIKIRMKYKPCKCGVQIVEYQFHVPVLYRRGIQQTVCFCYHSSW